VASAAFISAPARLKQKRDLLGAQHGRQHSRITVSRRARSGQSGVAKKKRIL
jgi:hypothetical protein